MQDIETDFFALARPMSHPPIALFVFNRPEHTRRVLASLAGNAEFADSPLHIYCDGPRHPGDMPQVEAVRQIVRDWPHPLKVVCESQCNQGLASAVISGVTEVCQQYGRIIVVEDDLVAAPTFLRFMGQALARYADQPEVMQIAGHMYPVPLPGHDDAIFLPFASSWGWATWARAWAHFDPTMQHYERLSTDRALRRQFDLDGAYPFFSFLRRQRLGKINSWYVRWNLSIFARRGLVLYPRHSLIRNNGFDGSGVHCGVGGSPYDGTGPLPDQAPVQLPALHIDTQAYSRVREFLRSKNTFLQRLNRRLRVMLSRAPIPSP
ncbi:MAG: hypothetical protein RLY71_1614 [Pseudomonadota bacterium]